MKAEEIFSIMVRTIGDSLNLKGMEWKRDTTFLELEGWDSLSYTLAILALEKAFQITMPMDRLYALENLGQLADLIQEVIPKE